MDIINRLEELQTTLDALVKKAELWQLIFDECPIAVACIDQNMNFFMINHEFCNLTGFSADDLIGKNISVLIPFFEKKKHSKYEKEYMKHPEKRTDRHGVNTRLVHSNGQTIKVSIDLSYIDYDDRIYLTVFIKRK